MAQFEARLDALRTRVQDQNFLHNLQGRQCSRSSAVPGGLDTGFSDFLTSPAIGECTTNVAAQLLGSAKCNQHAYIQQAAVALRQTITGPYRAPHRGGDMLLQCLAIRAGVAGERRIHEVITHDISAYLNSCVVTAVVLRVLLSHAH